MRHALSAVEGHLWSPKEHESCKAVSKEYSNTESQDVRDTRKWTCYHQKHPKVSCAWVEGDDHDDYTNDAEHSGCDNMPAVFHVATHRPGHGEDEDVGEQVRWCLDQICHKIRVAECRHDL